MAQAIDVIGGYAYPCMIGHIFIQRAVMPMMGNAVDEVKTAADAVALGVLEDGLADVLEAVIPGPTEDS